MSCCNEFSRSTLLRKAVAEAHHPAATAVIPNVIDNCNSHDLTNSKATTPIPGSCSTSSKERYLVAIVSDSRQYG